MTSTSRPERKSLSGFFHRLWQYQDLLRDLVRRDLSEAYAGSMLSRAWAILHPLFLISLYVVIFGFVFVTRLPGDVTNNADYAVFLLAGLVSWLTIQASLAKSTSSLVAASSLVKQVAFPVELLPIKSVIASQLPFIVGIFVVTAYSGLRFGIANPLLPLVLYIAIAQTALLCGIGLFLSALTVFVRDTRDILQFSLSFGIFLLPVFYLPGTLPHTFEVILYLNPFSYIIWCMQDVFFFHEIHHPAAWGAIGILGVLSLIVGHWFFVSTRDNFGDAL